MTGSSMDYLKKVFVGFLYGLGFALGLAMIGYLLPSKEPLDSGVVATVNIDEVNDKRKQTRQKAERAMGKLVVVDRGRNMGRLGPEYMLTVKNESDFKFTWVYPEVELFGGDGKLLSTNVASLKPIVIGRNTWIGNKAIILADVGDQCIIGAGSIVTKPISSNSVAVGNPAKVIRKNE